ncbi:unnamed protein product [Schistocephalus solidus]|uniref:UBIQUITIN_CONJUGAT_2 domain-containing protein n=1 Tax=Schistocephalus solidus TaxID=70667 RepID=A0A183TAW8_SCHSO|nr:unnamed protein product [Schistocephalus solidus]
MDDYPFTAPDLRLLTPIFHPNIREDDGYICVSILSDWNSFLDAVKAVLYLLSNPNFEDPNNPYGILRAEYRDRFDEVCRQFLAGFPVQGRSFPPNESWCTWARANNCFPSPSFDQRSREPYPLTQHISADPPVTGPKSFSSRDWPQDRCKRNDSDITINSVSSSYVPAFANIRYSVGTERDSFGTLFEITPCACFQTVRIVFHRYEGQQPSVFYFCDYLGCHGCQWYPGNIYLCNDANFDGEKSQSAFAFSSSTCTFIPWAEYEPMLRLNHCWGDEDEVDSLRGVSRLFGEESVNVSTGEQENDEQRSCSSSHEDSLSYLYFGRNNTNNQLLRHCDECNFYYANSMKVMQDIKPPSWIFSQTRWPPVLAPGQVFDCKANCPNFIPSWRGSTSRLVQDLIHFHCKYPRLDFILLLDPLALSPWSPIVNLLRSLSVEHSSTSTPGSSVNERWTSLLWLSMVDTFSADASVECFAQLRQHWLQVLARLTLISNWLAWFSRLEISAVLGQSRYSPRLVSEGVATACVHPSSLGCGQSPLLDVWPVWLARLVFRMFCRLVTRLSFSSNLTARCCFPLSDTDEI